MTKDLRFFRVLAVVIPILAAICPAQTPDPQPLGPPPDLAQPHLTVLPQEEDFVFLKDPVKRTDFWDPLKFMPLGAARATFLSLGFEYRGEYENFRNVAWGAGPQDDSGYGLERIMPHADLRVGNHFRVFSELHFDDVFGRDGGPRPGIDRDRGDVHQTFAEIGSDLHGKQGYSLRAGRQELVFGTGRLIDDNEGVNVKFAFDGFRATARKGSSRIDLFAVKPVEINPGFFDDSPDHRRSLWGVYGTATVPHGFESKADFYYIGYDAKQAMYQLGAGREIRHSAGVRVFNREAGQPPTPGVDYNWEGVVQWGALGPNSIHAWTAATETGYTLAGKGWHPRFALRADAASGTRNPEKHDLGTFNALFPRGAYFGPKLFLAGPSNFVDLHPIVQFSPRKNVSVSTEWVFFWRESTSDGIYAPNGMLLRPVNLSRSRFIGSQPNLEVRWAIDAHLTAAFNIAGFFTGPVLNDTPPSGGVAFGNGGLTYRF